MDYIDTIVCGSCEELMRDIPSCYVDLTVTSPPYDNLRNYNGYSVDFEKTISELYRITKDGGHVVWITSDETVNGSESGTSFRNALRFMKTGFLLNDTMIWSKPTFTSVGALKYRYPQTFEYMFVFTKGKSGIFNPIKDRKNISAHRKIHVTIREKDGSMRKKSNIGKRCGEYGIRFNVWNMPSVCSKKERTGHPAQFPIRLAQDHILSWSNEGDVVFDPFVGSGTTAIAAIRTRRHYIGFDISEQYCDLANQRIEKEKENLYERKT